MFLTCAKARVRASNLVFVLGMAGVALSAGLPLDSWAQSRGSQVAQPVSGAVTVSDSEFNTFVFGSEIKRIFFPSGSPVVGQPIYLADNTQVMLQFAKGHSGTIQMVAELGDGQVVTLRLVTRAVPGVTHSVNGARPRAPGRVIEGRGTASSGAAPRGEDIELLKHMSASGEAPSGFSPVALPPAARFDKFSVVPLAGWSDGVSKRVLVFSLVATQGQTAVVSPPQFYRPGITAVMIDGDVVDANNSPQLFVVEDFNDE